MTLQRYKIIILIDTVMDNFINITFLFQRKILLLHVESYVYSTANISLWYYEYMFTVL